MTLTEWLRASRDERAAALHACIDRIRAIDASVHAWAQVAPLPVLADGTLAGIPFGVKDIIETRGLSTEYGSPIYKGRVGTTDAAIVEELRQRGAVLLGKTETTAFAYRTPAPTRNPRDLNHTPGGSSSGSAAAVAAGMVPMAIGTQTLGSVLRPASYCGVIGFKPTYGVLPMDGVLPFAPSLDTLGFFSQTAADMEALWQSIGQSVGSEDDVPIAVPEPLPDVEPAMAVAFRRAVSQLRRGGARLDAIDIRDMLARLSDAATAVMFYEASRVHEQRYREHGVRLGDLADLVRDGLEMTSARYDDATRFIAAARKTMTEIFKATPIVALPAATGAAPRGLMFTGDPRLNAPWTALGTPALSVPMPRANDLPLGLQLVADRGGDARLLRAAMRVERLLAEAPAAG